MLAKSPLFQTGGSFWMKHKYRVNLVCPWLHYTLFIKPTALQCIFSMSFLRVFPVSQLASFVSKSGWWQLFRRVPFSSISSSIVVVVAVVVVVVQFNSVQLSCSIKLFKSVVRVSWSIQLIIFDLFQFNHPISRTPASAPTAKEIGVRRWSWNPGAQNVGGPQPESNLKQTLLSETMWHYHILKQKQTQSI